MCRNLILCVRKWSKLCHAVSEPTIFVAAPAPIKSIKRFRLRRFKKTMLPAQGIMKKRPWLLGLLCNIKKFQLMKIKYKKNKYIYINVENVYFAVIVQLRLSNAGFGSGSGSDHLPIVPLAPTFPGSDKETEPTAPAPKSCCVHILYKCFKSVIYGRQRSRAKKYFNIQRLSN